MEIKGTALIPTVEFLTQKFGEHGLEKWLSQLSPEAEKVYRNKIYPTGWYPLKEIFTEPSVLMSEMFYHGDFKLCGWESGRFSARYALRGIYKLFVKLGSPGFLIKRGSVVMQTYYRPCALEVVSNEKKSGTVRITKFAEPHSFLDASIAGWVEHALEISGCKKVRVEIPSSMAKGDAYTEIRGSWL